MNDFEKEKLLDLLIAKATTGLSEEEAEQLNELERKYPEVDGDDSFEKSAAMIGMINLQTAEPMPEHLHSKILASADEFFAAKDIKTPKQKDLDGEKKEFQKTFDFEPQRRSIWQSLGWLVAAFACIALAVNLWVTRSAPPAAETVRKQPAPVTPAPTPNFAEQRAELLASADDVVVESWTDIDPKQPRNIQGDIVWSNSRQKGFIRLRNLPVNDRNKEAYQLWIFDETQKHPIDGGVFDAERPGEIVVPIDPKLKVQKPTMFAVTAEKPGGVVVSEQEKVMAIAKVET